MKDDILKVACIVWADITTHSEWASLEDSGNLRPEVFVSFGVVVKKTRKLVRIAPIIGRVATTMTTVIPRGCILYMEEIPWKSRKIMSSENYF